LDSRRVEEKRRKRVKIASHHDLWIILIAREVLRDGDGRGSISGGRKVEKVREKAEFEEGIEGRSS